MATIKEEKTEKFYLEMMTVAESTFVSSRDSERFVNYLNRNKPQNPKMLLQKKKKKKGEQPENKLLFDLCRSS